MLFEFWGPGHTIGLDQLFDDLLVSAELGHLKNDPDFFRIAHKQLQRTLPDLRPEEILFIDHDEENIKAAEVYHYHTYTYHDLNSFRAFLSEKILV